MFVGEALGAEPCFSAPKSLLGREGLNMPFDSIEQALEDIRQGKIIIVADDEDRENEGDLVCAASLVTPEAVNFMTRFGRGLICVALTQPRATELGLPLMTDENSDPQGTAFTISVDAHQRFGVTTGISAHDRAKTIQVLVDPNTEPGDLRRPGHIFPLKARPGGVLRRVGQTEAGVDLARMAGLPPVGVICEILNPDGSMARRPELELFAQEHGLSFITVAQLVSYRLAKERLVTRVAEANLPTEFGPFRIIAYQSPIDDREHIALVKGDVEEYAARMAARSDEGPAEDQTETLAEDRTESQSEGEGTADTSGGTEDHTGEATEGDTGGATDGGAESELDSGTETENDDQAEGGEVTEDEDEGVLVRMHSECMTGDVFGSLRCDCGAQLDAAVRQIAEKGRGVIVYLKQEGRGIGLHNKIRAYELQDQGHDTVEANQALGFKPDLRDYGIGAQILLDLGLRKIRLLTNNPRKIIGLEGYNLEVTGREPLQVGRGEHNEAYLDTKKSKLGHLL
jgi:3,4-dihydroxy 2-butanone 4-phosphate synthase/GTP cyclohydrolase II